MRTRLTFDCEGDRLAATLDRGSREAGLLILSGGNEIAIGPQRAMARLAGRIARGGWPVFRFDRRGIGDSEGRNGGFLSSAADLRAAAAAFAAVGRVRRIVAFGNCDAATALALNDPGLPPDAPGAIAARILGNPWLDLRGGDLPPPAAIKRHYRQRLTDPAAWRALLGGRIDLRKAARGLSRIATPAAPPTGLTKRFAAGLHARPVPTRIVVADGDATGIAFADAWERPAFASLRETIGITRIPTPAHGFTREADLDALAAILARALAAVEPDAAG